MALIYYYTSEDIKLEDVNADDIYRKWCRIEFALQFEDKMKKEKIRYG